jgi:hypothetical protein
MKWLSRLLGAKRPKPPVPLQIRQIEQKTRAAIWSGGMDA